MPGPRASAPISPISMDEPLVAQTESDYQSWQSLDTGLPLRSSNISGDVSIDVASIDLFDMLGSNTLVDPQDNTIGGHEVRPLGLLVGPMCPRAKRQSLVIASGCTGDP